MTGSKTRGEAERLEPVYMTVEEVAWRFGFSADSFRRREALLVKAGAP